MSPFIFRLVTYQIAIVQKVFVFDSLQPFVQMYVTGGKLMVKLTKIIFFNYRNALWKDMYLIDKCYS